MINVCAQEDLEEDPEEEKEAQRLSRFFFLKKYKNKNK